MVFIRALLILTQPLSTEQLLKQEPYFQNLDKRVWISLLKSELQSLNLKEEKILQKISRMNRWMERGWAAGVVVIQES